MLVRRPARQRYDPAVQIPLDRLGYGDPQVKPVDPDGPDLEELILELGQRDYFNDRISRHKADRGLLLIAWLDGRPAGDVYLWLEPAEESAIRCHLDGVPLLTHLEVRADLRCRGIGTRLIAAAERELVERGESRVALAVEEKNTRATALYTRLGYRNWGRPSVECHPYDDGAVELCHVLVKDLVVPSGGTRPLAYAD